MVKKLPHFKLSPWPVFFILLTGLLLVYGKHINALPEGVHSWAQADRFAVAKMFQDNNNILAPQTLNISSTDGRCGVEFPFVQYISAKFSQITGTDSLPAIYRILNLLILFGGSFFLIRTWSQGHLLTLITGITACFSPLLLFYGFNFLPDTTGLGFVLFAFGYILKFERSDNNKFLYLSIAFAGLATLVKTTSGIYFISINGGYFLYFLFKRDFKRLIGPLTFALSLAAVIILYDYFLFHKVNKEFWSIIFMSQSHPIHTSEDLRAVWKAMKYWHGQYLTWPQTILLVGLGIPAITKIRRLKLWKPTSWILLLSFIGAIGFLGVMGTQFINHDYYFIASVVPLTILSALISITSVKDLRVFQKSYFLAAIAGLCIWSIVLSVQNYEPRTQSHFVWKNRDIINETSWMKDGDKLLNDIGISDDAVIFVGYAAAPNTSLVYFNRKGKVFNHEEMTRNGDNMEYWKNRLQPDYFIFPSAWVSKLELDQPRLYGQVVLFAKRPGFHIYKPIN